MSLTQDARKQIETGTLRGRKDYTFREAQNLSRPAQHWFQTSHEGDILFVVFYSQACRWSRCLGCNLPSTMSRDHVDFRHLMAQVDYLLELPEVRDACGRLRKVIVSNNGSVLDEATFSSTALIYLVAKLNMHLPRLEVLSLESRVEYVDTAELEFLARALREGETPTTLELAVGFEAFSDRIRNGVFQKGLELDRFERMCEMLAAHAFRLKCYFMQKPVPEMSDQAAIEDIHQAIDYLDALARQRGLIINLHLNPTYAASGTELARAFREGRFSPPRLLDVIRAVLQAQGKRLSVFVGLSDEGLACPGGSFLRPGDGPLVERLEEFNRTQDFARLAEVVDSV